MLSQSIRAWHDRLTQYQQITQEQRQIQYTACIIILYKRFLGNPIHFSLVVFDLHIEQIDEWLSNYRKICVIILGVWHLCDRIIVTLAMILVITVSLHRTLVKVSTRLRFDAKNPESLRNSRQMMDIGRECKKQRKKIAWFVIIVPTRSRESVNRSHFREILTTDTVKIRKAAAVSFENQVWL